MDWSAWLGLPATVLLIGAAVLLLLSLWELVALRQRLGERRAGTALLHGAGLLLAAVLTVLLALAGLSLRGYRLLNEEVPVVQLDARILSPQRWALTVAWPDGGKRQLALSGDAFRVEAVVLKWDWPILPPLYRLDRLSGRYDDAQQEASAPRSVFDFKPAGEWDLLDLKRRYPRLLPGVDSLFGSGVYLPLVDQGHYTVSLMRSGALVARPDDATAQRIGQPLGD